jgi:hypothetical protein
MYLLTNPLVMKVFRGVRSLLQQVGSLSEYAHPCLVVLQSFDLMLRQTVRPLLIDLGSFQDTLNIQRYAIQLLHR